MSPPTKMRQHRVGLRVRAPAAALMVALLLSHAHEPLARLTPEHAANHSAVHRPRGMISPAREQVGVLPGIGGQLKQGRRDEAPVPRVAQ